MLLDHDFWPSMLIPSVYRMTSCLEASRFFPLQEPLVGYESRGKERKRNTRFFFYFSLFVQLLAGGRAALLDSSPTDDAEKCRTITADGPEINEPVVYVPRTVDAFRSGRFERQSRPLTFGQGNQKGNNRACTGSHLLIKKKVAQFHLRLWWGTDLG